MPKAGDGVQIQKTNCELLIIVFQNIKALYLGDLTTQLPTIAYDANYLIFNIAVYENGGKCDGKLWRSVSCTNVLRLSELPSHILISEEECGLHLSHKNDIGRGKNYEITVTYVVAKTNVYNGAHFRQIYNTYIGN